MLIKHKERKCVLFRVIALAIACLLLWNDLAFALAPELRSTQTEFKGEYKGAYDLLIGIAFNGFVKSKLPPGGVNQLITENPQKIRYERIQLDGKSQQILIVPIPDLRKGTGVDADIRFDKQCDKTVIYIDARRYNDQTIINLQKSRIRDWHKKIKGEDSAAPAAAVSRNSHAGEPLIGHGFGRAELDEVKFNEWGKGGPGEAITREVRGTIDALKQMFSAIPPDTHNRIRSKLQLMQRNLELYEKGREGRKLGIIESRYDDDDHFYLGFAAFKKIGLAREFFDKNNPLYAHRVEVLFHELCHATFDKTPDRGTIEDDGDIHLLSLQMQAVLFWGIPQSEIGEIGLFCDSDDLAFNIKNKFRVEIYNWKRRKRNIAEKLERDDWKSLLRVLRGAIATAKNHLKDNSLLRLLHKYEDAAEKRVSYPIEARYPLLRAVSLLERDEKVQLKKFIKKKGGARKLKIADAVLLMIDKKIPKDWVSQQAPDLQNRSVWQFSSEIWKSAGGLGRVMQFHGRSMKDLLQEKVPLCQVEPYYEDTDYKKIFKGNKDHLKEVLRFEVLVSGVWSTAVCYRINLDCGITLYLVKGFKSDNMNNPFFTKGLYNYDGEYDNLRNPFAQKCSLSEFSAFFSLASLELASRIEGEKMEREFANWKPPILHFNDGQLGLAPFFRKVYYQHDYVLRNALVAFTTHTYRNRCFENQHAGNDEGLGAKILRCLMIDEKYWRYFHHQAGEDMGLKGIRDVIDLTSAGIRSADWVGGVSAKHVDDILKYDRWPWSEGEEWKKLAITAVTNGDNREVTAHKFREAMKEVCAKRGLDLEHPTPDQIITTKKETKRRLSRLIGEKIAEIADTNKFYEIKDDLPVISYTGRVVDEKAGRGRSFSNDNIREMVKRGWQVIIGANNSSTPDIVYDLEKLMRDITVDKERDPAHHQGNFIILHNIDIENQRAILAATDIQIQDSERATEAAGYTEADAGACGALELAPPWREGLLQSQGIAFNKDNPGEGNTLSPKNDDKDSYLEVLKEALIDGPRESGMSPLEYLARYQANAVRLSQILDSRMTAAEYLRQWSEAIRKRDAAGDNQWPAGKRQKDAKRRPSSASPSECPCPDAVEIMALLRRAGADSDDADFERLAPLAGKDPANLFAILFGLRDNILMQRFLNAVRQDEDMPEDKRQEILFDARNFIIGNPRRPAQIVCQIPLAVVNDSIKSPGKACEMLDALKIPAGGIAYLLGALPSGRISEKIFTNKREATGDLKGYFLSEESVAGGAKVIVKWDKSYNEEEIRKNHRGGSPFSVYDPSLINPALGTEDDFRLYIDLLHSRGYKAIIDFVGHFSPDSPIVIGHPEWMRDARRIDGAEMDLSDAELLKKNPGHFILIKGDKERWLISHNKDWLNTDPKNEFWPDTAAPDWGKPQFREHMFSVIEKWAGVVDGVRVDMAHLIPAGFRAEALDRARAINPRFVMIEEVYHGREEESISVGGTPCGKYVYDWINHPETLAGNLGRYFGSRPGYLKDVLHFAGNHDDEVANAGSGRASQLIAATLGGSYMFYAPHVIYGPRVHYPVQATHKRWKDELEGREDAQSIEYQARLINALQHPAFARTAREMAHSNNTGILTYLAGKREEKAAVIANISGRQLSTTVDISGLVARECSTFILYDALNGAFYVRKAEELRNFYVDLKQDGAHLFFARPVNLPEDHPLIQDRHKRSFNLSEIKQTIEDIDKEGSFALIIRKMSKLPVSTPPAATEPEGPALFFDPETGEVRELSENEHEEGLHIAIRNLVKFNKPAALEFDDNGVRRLTEDETEALAGRNILDAGTPRSPPISIYIIDDDHLTNKLPPEYKHIAKGLITHAGTWRDGTASSGTLYANLFMTHSIYETLISLPDDSKELKFWREHEIGHLNDREAPIDKTLSDNDIAFAKAIYEKRNTEQCRHHIINFVKEGVFDDPNKPPFIGDGFDMEAGAGGRIYFGGWREESGARHQVKIPLRKLKKGDKVRITYLNMINPDPDNITMPQEYIHRQHILRVDSRLGTTFHRFTKEGEHLDRIYLSPQAYLTAFIKEGVFDDPKKPPFIGDDFDMEVKAGGRIYFGFWMKDGVKRDVKAGLYKLTPDDHVRVEKIFNIDGQWLIKIATNSSYYGIVYYYFTPQGTLNRWQWYVGPKPQEKERLLEYMEVKEAQELLIGLGKDYMDPDTLAQELGVDGEHLIKEIGRINKFLKKHPGAAARIIPLNEPDIPPAGAVARQAPPEDQGDVSLRPKSPFHKELGAGPIHPEGGISPLTVVPGGGKVDNVPLQTVDVREDMVKRNAPIKGGESSPAELLKALREDPLFAKAMDKKEGLRLDGMASDEVIKTVSDVVILVPIAPGSSDYCFSDMMRGENEDDTKTFINALQRVNWSLPIADLREFVKMAIISEMEKEFAVPDKKVMWHIIERDVIPEGQRSTLIQAVNNKFDRDNNGFERIMILRENETIAGAIAEIRSKDQNAIIDAALSDVSHIDAVGDEKVKKMVFACESGTEFIQLEGVIKALRALHYGDADETFSALSRLYSAIAGIPPEGHFYINDSGVYVFNLPRIRRENIDDISELNKGLLEALTAA